MAFVFLLTPAMQELGCAMPHSVFSLAEQTEQCHTHEFLYDLKMKTTPKNKTNQIIILTSKIKVPYKIKVKRKTTSKMKTTSEMKMTQKMKTT